MSRKANLAVVEEVPIRQTDIEQAVQTDAAVAEEAADGGEPAAEVDEAPAASEVKTRKTRTPRAAFVAEDIEDDVPPPSRIIKYTLAELIKQIPVGKSRVIIGTKASAVERAAKTLGVEVITSNVEGRAGDVRVWRV